MNVAGGFNAFTKKTPHLLGEMRGKVVHMVRKVGLLKCRLAVFEASVKGVTCKPHLGQRPLDAYLKSRERASEINNYQRQINKYGYDVVDSLSVMASRGQACSKRSLAVLIGKG